MLKTWASVETDPAKRTFAGLKRGPDGRFADADLWIDIKGNGEIYTPEVEERFGRALPARLESSGVTAGLTVCLTGRLLDFVWEGPSSVERLDEAGGPVSVLRARSVRGEEILVADIGLP